MPTGGLDVAAGSFLAGALGETAAGALGAAALGGELGAGLGGLESAISGGNVLKGVERGGIGGALTGGGIGLAGSALGGTIGTTAADVLGGAAGGALGGKLTGGSPLTGAVEGGISGGIASALSPSTSSAAPAAGGPGAGAAGAAAPSGIPTDLGDVTQSFPSDPNNLPSLTGSSATSSPNVGTGTTGTQSLPGGLNGGNLGSQITQAAGGQSFPADPSNLPSLASTATPSAPPSSVENFLSKPGAGTAFDVVKANPGAAISAAGIGLDALKGNQQSGAEKNLEAQAGQLAGQGVQLENYLQSGSLPPGLQSGINQASESAKATIRSQYASRGMSGSSAEQQELAAVDQRAQAQASEMAMQLLQTGISETGMASGLYEKLLANQTANDASLGSAISNFASAAAGGGQNGRGGITVNYSGNA